MSHDLKDMTTPYKLRQHLIRALVRRVEILNRQLAFVQTDAADDGIGTYRLQ